jgi:RNA polymerase sigma-70 factor (ECF subfamily)
MRRKWYQVLPWPEPEPQLTTAPEQQPDRQLVHGEQRDAMLRAVDTLGEKHRLVVILRYYGGLSNEEIAQALNIPSGTVRSRLFTARQRLKAVLVEQGEWEKRNAERGDLT